ncbi:MAG TPA: CDP-diacylglycerol--serine O-phosphatidyltransferase [Bryobacteraceae bacterium]|nr:CDP-diacylglycerol--serine O-phosphatidyltransferase [Bryobacteraceae bacterium]
MNLRERLVDPKSPERRPRRAAYALPTLFTAGNVFFGFYALIEIFQGAMQMAQGSGPANQHFVKASLAIGLAVFLDGLDGRIARMTNTVSDFGREMDSLADVIAFGIAPAALAFVWGVQFVDPAGMPPQIFDHFNGAGYFCAFLFLLCGAMRLARFNIQKNPMPKNPGRPDRKYFVGLAIPSGAAVVASIVYACDGVPLHLWTFSAAWMALLALLSFLMVSTWRYPSFKDLSLTRPRSPITFVLIGIVIFLVWRFPQAALLAMSAVYMLSGIVLRIGGAIRRRIKPAPPQPEHQVG